MNGQAPTYPFDGLWQVTTPDGVCAGFMIKKNQLVEVAPILRGRLFMLNGRIWFDGRFSSVLAERVTDR